MNDSSSSTPIIDKGVTADELCKRFNDGRYWERAKAGEFTEVVIGKPTPARLDSKQEPGTLSQMVSYRDGNDREVARVHQYLKPDGSIGGSGRPDPKILWEGGILYRQKRKNE